MFGGRERRQIRNAAFPVVNRNGPDQLIYVHCDVVLNKRDDRPRTTQPRFAEVIFRYRCAAAVQDPPYTFYDTKPGGIHLSGDSFQLLVTIVDRIALYGASETRTIVATGCLPGNDGDVVAIDQTEFDRKVDFLCACGLRDFLFIFPKGNLVEAFRERLQQLEKECKATCLPIDNIEEVKFLWKAGIDRPRLATWTRMAARAAAALVVLYVAAWLASPVDTFPRFPSPPLPVTAKEDRRINTASENSTYHNQFCPPLRDELFRADFSDYQCALSEGTIENIARALKHLTSINFVQRDVFSMQAIVRPADFDRLKVIVTDACEGLWMVSNRKLSYDEVADRAARPDFRFVLPDETKSGSAATFAFLQAKDERLRYAKKQYVADSTQVLNEVAGSSGPAVGFFVQYADAENANFERMTKLMDEGKINIIPVMSKEVFNIQMYGYDVYQPMSFKLKSGGLFDIFDLLAKKVTTACTPVAIITGNPTAFEGEDKKNQEARIDAIEKVSRKLVARSSRLVWFIGTIMEPIRRVAG